MTEKLSISRPPNAVQLGTGYMNTVESGLSGSQTDDKETKKASARPPPSLKYLHAAAVHSKLRKSCLSPDSDISPSFLGFRNLMILVLIVMNLRLVLENFIKYGVLVCIRCHDYPHQDILLGAILYALVPCHLLVAYIVESAGARQAQEVMGRIKRNEEGFENYSKVLENRSFQSTWTKVAWAHGLNALLCLIVTTTIVYRNIDHPLIGTICEIHAIIVFLKTWSYALTNTDLRRALLDPDTTESLPAIYSECPYPRNVTLGNLCYFWWAPTLVYQPVYPRSSHIRWVFVAKRIAEGVGLTVFIWLASAQYAAPVLQNSLHKIDLLDFPAIIERLMKLSTISLIIWLAGFFAVFHSILNALAEVMRFGDREFYSDWWNSPSVGAYWRLWNRPVYHFMRRHIHSELVGRGYNSNVATVIVFLVSGLLHELAVGVPTHNILGVAFAAMTIQIPLISVTSPLEKMRGKNGKVVGNCIFWISFCLVGQPLAALLCYYFFAWHARYGRVGQIQGQWTITVSQYDGAWSYLCELSHYGEHHLTR